MKGAEKAPVRRGCLDQGAEASHRRMWRESSEGGRSPRLKEPSVRVAGDGRGESGTSSEGEDGPVEEHPVVPPTSPDNASFYRGWSLSREDRGHKTGAV